MASALPPNQLAPIFMEKPAELEWLRGNLFRIYNPNTGVEGIIEAAVLAEWIANAARVYRDYRTAQSAEVIPFLDRVEAAAH